MWRPKVNLCSLPQEFVATKSDSIWPDTSWLTGHKVIVWGGGLGREKVIVIRLPHWVWINFPDPNSARSLFIRVWEFSVLNEME